MHTQSFHVDEFLEKVWYGHRFLQYCPRKFTICVPLAVTLGTILARNMLQYIGQNNCIAGLFTSCESRQVGFSPAKF